MSFKNLKLSIFLVAFVFVAQIATGQTLPNANVWGNTLLSAQTQNSDTSGYISLSQLNNALYVNINNVVNVPVTNRIIYSNGTNLTSNSGLTYSGSSFGVTGTGVFTGTVSGANAASAGQFTTLSQLQSSVSGTTNYVPKFTATNTIGNSNLQDDNVKIKISNKPIQNELSTSLNIYRDIGSYNSNGGALTGALVFEMPVLAGGTTSQMHNYKISGYNYQSGQGAWDLVVGVYYSSNAVGQPGLNADILGSQQPSFESVKAGYNPTTGKYVLILGDTTTVWNYPKIVIKEVMAGFNTSNALGATWNSYLTTTLTAFSGISTTPILKSLKNTREYGSNLTTLSQVIAYKSQSAAITGAMIIETPIVQSANQMSKFLVHGYNYAANKSNWEIDLGAYFNNFGHTPNLATIKGETPFTNNRVRIAFNTVTARYAIILGDTNTVWAYPSIFVDRINLTHASALNMNSGWSVSPQTSLANYSNIVTPKTYQAAYLEKEQTFTASQTATNFVSNVATGTQPYATTSTTINTNLNADLLDGQHGSYYQNATNINAGTLADARLSSNAALKNIDNNFSVNQTIPNASTGGHALNQTTGDARYLGIAATAANATLLNGQAASYYNSWANLTGVPSTFTPSSHVHSGADITSGTLADARLSSNAALKNIDNNFSVNQTVPNATTIGHALNQSKADSLYLGITATATNSNALRGLDTNVIAQRNAVQIFTQKNTFQNQTVFSGAIYTDNAPDHSPYVDGTDRMYVMKGDGQLRSKTLQDLIKDISANDTFALTGNTGAVFNLSSTGVTVVDLGLYTGTMGSNNVLEFRLASGNPFFNNQQITITATGQIICGQGSKIRLADNSGTMLVQACNDQLATLTEAYEFADNPLRNFSITFQYSKKRNLWRVANFKNWGDL